MLTLTWKYHLIYEFSNHKKVCSCIIRSRAIYYMWNKLYRSNELLWMVKSFFNCALNLANAIYMK